MSRKAEQVCRFGVRSHDMRISKVWRVWTLPRTGKSDVYLTCGRLAGIFKASLHQSGTWQVSFTSQFTEKISDRGTWKKTSRHFDSWQRPDEIGPGVTLALTILIPASELRKDENNTGVTKLVHWVAAPSVGLAVSFDILITKPETTVSDWPGKRSMGTQLVARMSLAGNELLWVVHRVEVVSQEVLDSIAKARSSQNAAIRLDSRRALDFTNKNLRVILMHRVNDGSYLLIEAAIVPEEMMIS